MSSIQFKLQFKRFRRLARGYWLDCRYSAADCFDKHVCYRAAAIRVGMDLVLFERIYTACFASRPDPLDALNEAITGMLDAQREAGISPL